MLQDSHIGALLSVSREKLSYGFEIELDIMAFHYRVEELLVHVQQRLSVISTEWLWKTDLTISFDCTGRHCDVIGDGLLCLMRYGTKFVRVMMNLTINIEDGGL